MAKGWNPVHSSGYWPKYLESTLPLFELFFQSSRSFVGGRMLLM